MNEDFKEVKKAVKVQLYPTNEQKILFTKNINHARFVFNKIKESSEHTYKIIKEHNIQPKNIINSRFCNIQLSQLKKSYKFLYESESTSLQASYENYIQSMKNFFQKRAKFPRYKSKRNPVQSFKVKNINNNVRIEHGKIKIAKHGFIRLRGLRKIKGKIQHITITQIANKWFASINYSKAITKPLKKTGKKIGIDVGIKDLAILSTGKKITKLNSAPYEEKITKLQKNLSRKKHSSKNWEKTRKKLTLAHLKLKNARNDYIQKITWKLVKKYDIIVIEDLKISNMMKNHKLAKNIANASWHELKRQLQYKCEWYNKELIIINPHNTSKECNNCGYINKELTLADREWTCPKCANTHDRDINAANNILNRWNNGDSLVTKIS